MVLTPARVDATAWVLIYGGLLALCLGIFVQREHVPIGWTLAVGGGAAAVAGVVLIWFRSTMKEQDP